VQAAPVSFELDIRDGGGEVSRQPNRLEQLDGDLAGELSVDADVLHYPSV
jgi:hypothetical protein